jgi:hypothetical protein
MRQSHSSGKAESSNGGDMWSRASLRREKAHLHVAGRGLLRVIEDIHGKGEGCICAWRGGVSAATCMRPFLPDAHLPEPPLLSAFHGRWSSSTLMPQLYVVADVATACVFLLG